MTPYESEPILFTDDAQSLLLIYIKRLSAQVKKGRKLHCLVDILNWFLASGDIYKIPYDFVFEKTILLEIMVELVFKEEVLDEDNTICVLRILGFLSSFNAPQHEIFKDQSFIKSICQIIKKSKNDTLIKHGLVIIGQLIQIYPSVFPFLNDIGFNNYLVQNYIFSKDNEVCAMACFISLIFILYISDEDEINSIILSTFELIKKGDLIVMKYAFRGMLMVFEHLEVLLKNMISCGLISILIESLKLLNNEEPMISCCILKILGLIIENNEDSVVSLNIPKIILDLNFLNHEPVNEMLVENICNVIFLLATKANPALESELIQSGIFISCIQCCQNTTYAVKLMVIKLFYKIIHDRNVKFLTQIIEQNLFQFILESIANSSNEFAIIILDIIIEFLMFYPNAKDILIEKGLENVINELISNEDYEVQEKLEYLLSIIEF